MPHFGAPALLLLQLLAALPATAAETDATPLRFSVMESFTDRLKVSSRKGKGTVVTMEKYIVLRERQAKLP